MRAETLPSNLSGLGRLPAEARIGPNAVLQTRRALKELEGEQQLQTIDTAVGLPSPFPEGMIPERWFLSYVTELRRALPPARAEAVLSRSGRYTADYVRTNRIPSAFRGLLRLLPARLALPLLLMAFRRHAWTFAGGGTFRVEGPHPGTICLVGCPTCRVSTAFSHGGSYYEAAFEGLLALATPRARVRELDCIGHGAHCCHFQITLEPRARG